MPARRTSRTDRNPPRPEERLVALRLLADEDFNNDVLEGLRRQLPDLDIVRVQDVGLAATVDAAILEWAARHDRILLTHDESTMHRHADARLTAGLPVRGVCIVQQTVPIRQRIEELLLLLQCLIEEDWQYPIWHVPV